MSNTDAAQQLASDISSLQSDVNSLQTKSSLSDARNALAEMDTTVGGLPQHVRDIRSRGYVFEKGMEDKANDFAARWTALRNSAQQQIDQHGSELEPELHAVEAQLAQITAWSNNPEIAGPVALQAKAAASALDSKVSAVESEIEGTYSAFKGDVDNFNDHLKQIDWMQSQIAEASFQFLPSEGAVAAVNAVWCKQGKQSNDDPQGILYLTDQRVLFEQKQEVATKKVLFVATQKQKVQQLLVTVPVAQVQAAQASKQGLMGHEDHLDVTYASGAPLRSTHFHISGQDSNVWQGLVMRAKASDFDGGRTTPLAQEQTDRVKSAPSKCPFCGGAITQPVLRGMDSIKCEFCGSVIRL